MRIRILGWALVAFSVLLLLASGTSRLAETFAVPGPTDDFGARYSEHPLVSLGHIVPGLVFLVLAPLQFVSRIRRRRIGVHRWLGRVLVLSAAASGVFAMLSAIVFPAFGGRSTLLATLLFGTIFLWALFMAVVRIRQKRVSAHREWMIRVFALGLGVATIRGVIGLSQWMTGRGLVDVFGFSFWLGFGINLAIGEAWIRYTRPRAGRVRTAF